MQVTECATRRVADTGKGRAGYGSTSTSAFKPSFKIMRMGLQHVVGIAQALHVRLQLSSSSLRLTGRTAPSACLLLCLPQLPCNGACCSHGHRAAKACEQLQSHDISSPRDICCRHA